MFIFNFDIWLAYRVLKIFDSNKLKFFSLLSDFLLIFYCIFLILVSFQNILFILLGWIIPNLLQKFFRKERPYFFFKLNIDYTTPKEHSFPSSHTFLSMFLFFKVLEINLFLAIPILLIPLLRVLSLQHWFSDIVFSMVLSISTYMFIITLLKMFA